VLIEAIKDYSNASAETESFGIRAGPAPNPDENAGGKETTHFFKDKATSNFLIQRNDNIVSAAVHGRNEQPDTAIQKPLDKLRNAVSGILIANYYKMPPLARL
jgi:hypothetical protein